MITGQESLHGSFLSRRKGSRKGRLVLIPSHFAQDLELGGAEIYDSISKKEEMILKCLTYVAFTVISPFKKSIFHRISSPSRVQTGLYDLGGSLQASKAFLLLGVGVRWEQKTKEPGRLQASLQASNGLKEGLSLYIGGGGE